MKLLAALTFALLFTPLAQSAEADLFTAKDLHSLGHQPLAKGAPYSDHRLGTYGNHYLLLVRRDATGSSEIHEHEADVFVVESGRGSIVTGGKLVGAHTTKPGEIRGASIQGGTKRAFNAGDVIHIPAGVPHQLLVDKTEPFVYFVVKVTGQ